MALQSNDETGYNNSGKTKKVADAYINIEVIDDGGNVYKLQAFNPLYSDGSGRLHRSLVNKAKASSDGIAEINCRVTVRLAAVDDGSDITF
jgi:hypothetical protein